MSKLTPLLILLITLTANAAPPVEQIDRAVKHLMERAPGRKLHKDSMARLELAKDINESATQGGVSPLLLTMVAFRESSFKDVPGKIGEQGLTQVHGKAANGCDLETRRGQLTCGARWLRKSFEMCGDWPGALTAYMSGECKPRNKKIAFLVRSRIALWERLEEL